MATARRRPPAKTPMPTVKSTVFVPASLHREALQIKAKPGPNLQALLVRGLTLAMREFRQHGQLKAD